MNLLSSLHRADCRVTANFVTRWYLTRHGFNHNYCGQTMDKEPEFFGINTEVMNETNVYNEWQGKFNYDALSLSSVRYLINSERSHLGNNVTIRTFITCFDQVTNKIYISNDDPYDEESYKCLMPFEFLQQFTSSVKSACGRGKIPACYVCCGEQPENIIKLRKDMISDLKQYDSENNLHDMVHTVVRGGIDNPIRYTVSDDSHSIRFYSNANDYTLTTTNTTEPITISYDDVVSNHNNTVPIGRIDTSSLIDAYNNLVRAAGDVTASNSTTTTGITF